MSDAVHLEVGAFPWLPSEETEPRAVFHRYDIPLVGVFSQHGVLYLFWCVTGHAAPENAWAYARVSEDEVTRLEAAVPDTFDEELRAAVGDGACSFAVASDEKGIIESVILNPPATFDSVHHRGMTEISDRFHELFNEYRELQERFPQLSAAAHFSLVPTPR